MAKRTAVQAEANLRGVEDKLAHAAQVLPFIHPPPLAAQMSLAKRMAEALKDSDPNRRGHMMDRLGHAALGQVSAGFSPIALFLAYADWGLHLASDPNRQWELARNAGEQWGNLCVRALRYAMGEKEECCPADIRFNERYKHQDWRLWPFNILACMHLSIEDWWMEACHVRGATAHHQQMMGFLYTLALSATSPENCPLLSPRVYEKIRTEYGMNFAKGASNAMEDIHRWWRNEAPSGTEDYQPGRNVATTEGRVVYRNALFELIQYTPKTRQVRPEPMLVIPAWIMKYYILDLSPRESMVKFLVEQGYTVFMISWKNPDASYRDVDFIDYLKEGALQALEVVQAIIPGRKVHAVGYCLGGTLLAMLAAYLANQQEDALQTITLFAAQTDFTHSGGLGTFIDEAQLTYLEDIMLSQGYLRGDQLSAAFNLLHPRELIWHRMMQEYVLGEREKTFGLMAWDKDTTRLPYRMHSQYLRYLYLYNCLAMGELEVDGETLDLDRIETPMFVVSAEKDHIAPPQSVYKIHRLTDAEITFVLANKGHNGGIISEPGHAGREFRIATRKAGGRYVQLHRWIKAHEPKPGSWWVAWVEWLDAHSDKPSALPDMGSAEYPPLMDAPGMYVHEH